MASDTVRPQDIGDTSLSAGHLLTEYEGWAQTLDRDSDDFDLIAKTKALYRFAINNYNEPGSDLPLRAIRTFEATERDPSR